MQKLNAEINPLSTEEVRALAAAGPDVDSRLAGILCLDDFEPAARRHLPHAIYTYIAGAAENGQSLRANRGILQEWSLVPRVLVDISRRSTSTVLLGSRHAAPFGIAPMGLQALSAYRGDLAMASAAAREDIPFIMSGSSLIALEEVAAAHPGAWFQAYLPGDDGEISALLQRVKAAGYGTLVLTVDTPVGANREHNVRAGFSAPLRPTGRLAWQGITHPRWLVGTFLKTLVRHGMPHFENNYAHRGAPIFSPLVQRDFSDRGQLDWRHFGMIRRLWHGPLVIKGVLDHRDARKAVNAGVDGIIVSNHGGRQLDGAVTPLRVLPRIVDACPEVPVMVDSGFRRGSDVLIALALGAKFVFVGRPISYAAAVAQEAGVRWAAALLKQEISRDMALLGITSLDELDASFLHRNQGS